jgi:hypothetical protein
MYKECDTSSGTVKLIHRNPLQVIKQLFAREDLAEALTLAYVPCVNEKGDRIYSAPCSSKDFEDFSVSFTP